MEDQLVHRPVRTAQELPFPDDSFDAVVCGYGIMHVPEPERALRARALLAAQSEVATMRIRQFLEESLIDLRNAAGGFDVPLPAVIGSGAKP